MKVPKGTSEKQSGVIVAVHLAGRLQVPQAWRDQWRSQRGPSTNSVQNVPEYVSENVDNDPDVGMYHDIFEIEAKGSLLSLRNCASQSQSGWWMHSIGNAAGLAALVEGSSSLTPGGQIMGLTWHLVRGLKVLLWFDRVESKSNPLDGLNRGVLNARGNCAL